jgi:hypothetical protein
MLRSMFGMKFGMKLSEVDVYTWNNNKLEYSGYNN